MLHPVTAVGPCIFSPWILLGFRLHVLAHTPIAGVEDAYPHLK